MAVAHLHSELWQTYSMQLRRRLRAALLALTVYPSVIVISVIGVAGYIRTTAGDTVGQFFLVLQDDIEVLVIVTIFVAIFIVPIIGSFRDRKRWFQFCSEIVGAMDNGNGLSFILARGACEKSVLLDEAIQAGSDPGVVLATGSCPQPIVTAFVLATDESDLKQRLGAEITQYQEESLRQLAVFERAAQPISVGLAGMAVIWLVVRIVVPYMVSRLGSGVV